MNDKPRVPWYKMRWWLILLILSPLLITAVADLIAPLFIAKH